MIQLYGSPFSTCTRKVLMTLLETGTPYQLNVIDFAQREHKTEPHVSRQPFGQVPAIDDDGFVLFESRAICRYLSAKANDALVPTSLRERALMDQWSSVEQSNVSPHAMKFIYHYVFKRAQEDAVLDAARASLELAFAALSKPLATQPFLVGDKLTIADIGHMPYLELLPTTPMQASLDKFPHVVAWSSRLRERETWRKIAGR
ncbi:MAG: glutathione S-transferase family protein [Myxococcales bacterium]|nr:MAG: glutathione S-transferase family protein [Myxococcales bacterium]